MSTRKIIKISKDYDAIKHEMETLKIAMCNDYTPEVEF